MNTRTFPRTTIESDGRLGGTCLWHRQHEWLVANTPVRACTICDGDIVDARHPDAHHLCTARVGLGLPTPRVDQRLWCQCTPCRDARTKR